MIGFATVFLGEVKALEDIQGHQGSDAMAVRRHFPHIVATIVDVNWLLPFGMVVRKVLQCYVTTGSIAKLHDFCG